MENMSKLLESKTEFDVIVNLYEVGKCKQGNKTYKTVTIYPNGHIITRYYYSDAMGNKYQYRQTSKNKNL